MTREALLYAARPGRKVVCALCAHRCVILPGKSGVCAVRENREGKLETHVYGEVCAAHVDPIEKKPFYHYRPGTTSLSIATVGCNFRCGFCQNWQISQAARESRRALRGQKFAPAEVVREAVDRGCASISYTYTEPTIFFEYAYDTARLAKEAGLGNNFVTNGYMTGEALRMIRPYLDAANVDLKAFRDETYRKVCGARLEPVLATIRLMRELGVWVEVTTLVVPGLNDSAVELREIAAFIVDVDQDIPWHISRFHPDYDYTDAPPTPMDTLNRTLEIGKTAGLRHVYLGNVLGQGEDTVCVGCGRTLIRRHGFFIKENRLAKGRCPDCGTSLAGVFD